MNISLSIDRSCSAIGPRDDYNDSVDDIGAILADLCSHLSENLANKFVVQGFGDDSWPVDVYTDLLVFLEQLPFVIEKVWCQEEVTLQFYEQGVERNIIMRPKGALVELECVSFTSWQPTQPKEEMHWCDLVAMLVGIKDDFAAYVKDVSPKLYHHRWFERWSETPWRESAN